jgi:Zn-finger nucleic acid-binding protein
MHCPNCRTVDLVPAQIGDVQVHTCPQCRGYWFANDELRRAKDAELADFRWFDVDLWSQGVEFIGHSSEHLCPACDKPLTSLAYNGSNVTIEACTTCHGVWLERTSFDALIAYITDAGDDEVLHHYTHALVKEAEEVFTGPEGVRSELHDLLTLLGLFKYKLIVEHDKLAKVLTNLPL